jgi:hypothetical protein
MKHPARMNHKALLVLFVFCGVVGLQAACTAGLLPHCHHPEVEVHHQDPCPEDHCRDNFPLPLKSDIQAQVTAGKALPAVDRSPDLTVARTAVLSETPASDPGICRPSGHFPLLI